MKNALSLIIQLTFLAFLASSMVAGKDYGDHHDSYRIHGKHSMDFNQIRESIDWSSDQRTLLIQLESSQIDVLNLITNLRANSFDNDGEFDRNLFKEQLGQNDYLLDEHKALMETFMNTVTEEQLQVLKTLRKNCRKNP